MNPHEPIWKVINVVTLGGGTGHRNVLRALCEVHDALIVSGVWLNIVAVPASLDDGSSSGDLRKHFDIPAPGDTTQCVLGLLRNYESRPVQDWADLLSFRFDGNSGLSSHTIRNLMLAAIFGIHGTNQQSVDILCQMLPLYGTIAPATFSTDAQLCADVVESDGSIRKLHGEDAISKSDLVSDGRRLTNLRLEPAPELNRAVRFALKRADKILLCPGNPICSISQNLLVPGIKELVSDSGADKIFISNLMNEGYKVPDAWTVEDYLDYYEGLLDIPGCFKTVICNDGTKNEAQVNSRHPVLCTDGAWTEGRAVCKVPLVGEAPHWSPADPIAHTRTSVQHSKPALAQTLFELFFESEWSHA